MSSTGGGIRFDLDRRNSKFCCDSTTARHRAMFGLSELYSYTRVSLRSNNTWEVLGSSSRDSSLSLFAFSFGGIEGANILGNMGFEPQGVDYGSNLQFEFRIEDLIKEFNIDENRITSEVSGSSSRDQDFHCLLPR